MIRKIWLASVFTLSLAYAQDAAPPVAGSSALPAYDAVAIKPNQSGSGSVHVSSNMDVFNATNISLKSLLAYSSNVPEDTIEEIPKAMESARFDIAAKVIDPDVKQLENLTSEQRRAMFFPVLLDRFHLKVHTEVRMLSVYEMSVAKKGPMFTASADTSTNKVGFRMRSIAHGMELNAQNFTMEAFAERLYFQVHRTVIDKTGLTGKYDLKMTWSPDDRAQADPDAEPSIFTAMQEQLGLKLQAAKGPVKILVVDHAEMPSEN